jgi:hypothetical protein
MRGRLFALAMLVALIAVPAADAATHQVAPCFWEGPISTHRHSTRGFDGKNFNFPEESATYWFARFKLPPGGHLVLRGRFPHGRYMSVNAYSDGDPTDALSDIRIRPKRGATNPFKPGHRRNRKRRGWRIRVLDAAVPAKRAPNTLYAKSSAGKSIELLYRVYEPDRGLDLTGGVGLPAAVVVQQDGKRLRGGAACAAINDPDRSIPVQTVPAASWRAATSCRPNHPAFNPPRLERFFNIDYATAAVLEDCTEAGYEARHQEPVMQQGGFYSNRDSAYVYGHLSRGYGPVLVLRGKLPTFPHTRNHQRVMGRGQLRFWSLCMYESRVTTRYMDCLADRQVAIDRRRRYTVVVSRRGDRPKNAVRRCGFSWLEWSKRGDGAGNPNYGALVMRNMLVSRGFKQAVQRVPQPGDEAKTMGPYLPRGAYSTKAAFEKRGCPR